MRGRWSGRRGPSLRACVLLLGLTLPASVRAQEAPGDADAAREAEMFGAPSTPDETPGEPAAPDPNLWGDRAIDERLAAANDPLQIGGRLYLRFTGSAQKDADPGDWTLGNPNLVDLYLDARPTRRLRAFVAGRLTHDTTIQTGDVDPLTGQAAEATEVRLDQIWLKFDLGLRAFVTLGKQRVKWGAARFWNPTDFLNADALDPLAIFDERLGVPLVEVHVPLQEIGGNLYFVGLPGGADTVDQVGGAARVEWLFATTEISASAAARKDQPLRLGADLSSALGPIDVKLEAAVQHGGTDVSRRWEGTFDPAALKIPTLEDRTDDWIPQVAAGFEYGLGYGDDDALYITGEYFFNDAGYDGADLYPWLLAADASRQTGVEIPGVDFGRGRDFTPFYLGRHYAALGLLLPAPGTWNDTTFVLSGLGNLSDRSFLVRFDYQVRVLTRLSVYAFAGAHVGEDGEFRLAIDVPAVPGVEGLEHGVHVPPTVADVGFWLAVDL